MFLRAIVGLVTSPSLAAIDFFLIRRRSLADRGKYRPLCGLTLLRQGEIGKARAKEKRPGQWSNQIIKGRRIQQQTFNTNSLGTVQPPKASWAKIVRPNL